MTPKLDAIADAVDCMVQDAQKLRARADALGKRADAENRTGYNPESVNKAIEAQNRSGRGRVGGKEVSAIHRLLQGRSAKPETVAEVKKVWGQRKDAGTYTPEKFEASAEVKMVRRQLAKAKTNEKAYYEAKLADMRKQWEALGAWERGEGKHHHYR